MMPCRRKRDFREAYWKAVAFALRRLFTSPFSARAAISASISAHATIRCRARPFEIINARSFPSRRARMPPIILSIIAHDDAMFEISYSRFFTKRTPPPTPSAMSIVKMRCASTTDATSLADKLRTCYRARQLIPPSHFIPARYIIIYRAFSL